MKTSLLACSLVLSAAGALAQPWPQLEHPPDTLVEGIGEQIRLNGVPMTMTRVRSRSSVDAVLAHYTAQLGMPVAHAHVGGTHVLSQRRDDHFITVSIRSPGDGLSEALLSIADMPAAGQAAHRPLGFPLPAGSELLSDMESVDGRVNARQLVMLNAHSLRTNLEHLSRSLADRGLTVDGPPLADADETVVQGFRGATGEARLVLVAGEGITRAILTLRLKRL